MDKRQYYSALKTLEQLEHTFLPPVKGYIFSDLLCKEIPKIRKSIEDQSNAELTVRQWCSFSTITVLHFLSFCSGFFSKNSRKFCYHRRGSNAPSKYLRLCIIYHTVYCCSFLLLLHAAVVLHTTDTETCHSGSWSGCAKTAGFCAGNWPWDVCSRPGGLLPCLSLLAHPLSFGIVIYCTILYDWYISVKI